jgi:hypothetical protein
MTWSSFSLTLKKFLIVLNIGFCSKPWKSSWILSQVDCMDLLSLWVGLLGMKEQMEGQGHQIYPLIILPNLWGQNQFGGNSTGIWVIDYPRTWNWG